MVTKKATAKKVEATTVNTIKQSATATNKNVQATADVVVKEMVENATVVKNIAEKAAKELTKKVDFKDTTKQLKSTAKT
ncbi:MAG: malonyl CoA-acyl carrier protein transacylase, partial [Saprospiraceae bacterium]